MKNKNMILIISITMLLVIGILFFLNQSKKDDNPTIDENTLYSKQFGDTILKFVRYDYVLGQNVLVGVEKSTDNGKTYTSISNQLITVSAEAKFLFMDESLAFAVSKPNNFISNISMGVYVSIDGGITFTNSEINYENPKIDIITIEDVPYFEDDILKLKCSIYVSKSNEDGYEDVELIFNSFDNGLTWNLELE